MSMPPPRRIASAGGGLATMPAAPVAQGDHAVDFTASRARAPSAGRLARRGM